MINTKIMNMMFFVFFVGWCTVLVAWCLRDLLVNKDYSIINLSCMIIKCILLNKCTFYPVKFKQ